MVINLSCNYYFYILTSFYHPAAFNLPAGFYAALFMQSIGKFKSMKIFIIPILILFSQNLYSQSYTIDTFKNAIASVNSFSLFPVYGFTSSKDIYTLGYNVSYENVKPLPVQLVRINLTKKTIEHKAVPTVNSAKGNLWISVFDNSGNVYLSVAVPVRTVIKVNLKDSIRLQDLGNPFPDGKSLIYSAAPGNDGKMYFGGSSGGTYWGSYDPATGKLEKHPPIDSRNDYVLSIAGDSEYVYAQTGQRNSVQLWSVRKKDDSKKLLCKITNKTRISLEAFTDGIYTSFYSDTLSGSFKLVNGEMVRLPSPPANLKRINYTEINQPNTQSVNAHFDPVENKLFYSVNNKTYESIDIKANSVRMDIRRIFSFPGDTENIYYAGDYYGNYYRYNLKEEKAYLLGATGYNIYSILPLNDSIVYFGGYPSGYIMQWNRNQPWTTQKFLNGKVVDARDANANPKILRYWKSEGNPAAGFHHTFQMIFDADKNIIGAGDVIRIGNAASIGVYIPGKDSVYGINYEPFTGTHFSGIAEWRKLVIYAMNSEAKKSKLYFYDPALDKMVDSIDSGFDDYGKIYIKGNILTGIANDRIYRIDIVSKKIMENFVFPKSSIKDSYRLSSGKYIITTSQQIPQNFQPSVALPYTNYLETNGLVYALKGNMMVRIKGLIEK